jgi:threonine aldolase
VADSEVDTHVARPVLLALEQTHADCGGAVLPLGYLTDARALADAHGLWLHVDGARLANAATALGVHLSRVAEAAHSVTLCLSKGLGAPVGSLLAGPKDFVARARRVRKALGGGMRQVGVLCAPGRVALERGPPRLGADHTKARTLAASLAGVPGVRVDVRAVATNIVFFDLDLAEARIDAPALVAALREQHSVRVGAYSRTRLRAVTHHQVSTDDVLAAAAAVDAVVRAARAAPVSA